MLPVAAGPIADGVVLVGNDGRITAVGRAGDLPAPDADHVDLGAAVLMPGLVNTHAHLELTALRGLARDLPFRQWIARVRMLKDVLDAAARLASARAGVLESFAAGITTTGDTGSSGAPIAAMRALGMRGVAFHEVFGPDPAQRADALKALGADLDRLAAHASERVTLGVSPHAPYTVSPDLLAAVVRLARARGAQVAMHLAESAEETSFIRRGEGPFADALRERGIAVHAQDCSPVAWAGRGGLLELAPLLIHCVETDAADMRAIATAHASVAHCPWSNHELGHDRMDLAGMRAAGVTVGLGTDSVVTGGETDLFRDARIAADGTGLTPRDTVRMMTLDGAQALKVAGVGALAPGAWADMIAIDATSLDEKADPEEFVALQVRPRDVRRTWVAGTSVWDNGAWPGVDAAAELVALEKAGAAARAALS